MTRPLSSVCFLLGFLPADAAAGFAAAAAGAAAVGLDAAAGVASAAAAPSALSFLSAFLRWFFERPSRLTSAEAAAGLGAAAAGAGLSAFGNGAAAFLAGDGEGLRSALRAESAQVGTAEHARSRTTLGLNRSDIGLGHLRKPERNASAPHRLKRQDAPVGILVHQIRLVVLIVVVRTGRQHRRVGHAHLVQRRVRVLRVIDAHLVRVDRLVVRAVAVVVVVVARRVELLDKVTEQVDRVRAGDDELADGVAGQEEVAVELLDLRASAAVKRGEHARRQRSESTG